MYVKRVQGFIKIRASTVHFFGGSSTWEAWQNACWVIAISRKELNSLKVLLDETRHKFKQDSVALVEGEVEFI